MQHLLMRVTQWTIQLAAYHHAADLPSLIAVQRVAPRLSPHVHLVLTCWEVDMWEVDMWEVDMWEVDMWEVDMWEVDMWEVDSATPICAAGLV